MLRYAYDKRLLSAARPFRTSVQGSLRRVRFQSHLHCERLNRANRDNCQTQHWQGPDHNWGRLSG